MKKEKISVTIVISVLTLVLIGGISQRRQEMERERGEERKNRSVARTPLQMNQGDQPLLNVTRNASQVELSDPVPETGRSSSTETSSSAWRTMWEDGVTPRPHLVSVDVSDEDVALFRDFERQAKEWAQADTVKRARMKPEFIRAASARYERMGRIMSRDAEAAFRHALPKHLRDRLPEDIKPLVERHHTERGEFDRLCVTMPDGNHKEAFGALFADAGYRSSVMEEKASMLSTRDIPLYALILDRSAALHDQPGRILPAEEVEILGLDPEMIHVELAGTLESFETEEAMGDEFQQAMETEDPISSSGSGKVLVIRVDFSDMPGDPLTISKANEIVDDCSAYFADNSYGSADFAQGAVVTDTLRMPQTAQWYKDEDDYYQLLYDARNAARAADPLNWDYVDYDGGSDNYGVWFDDSPVNIFGWAGLASVGANRMWIDGYFRLNVVGHELGHNFGFGHANAWKVKNGSPIDETSSYQGYANPVDIMGNKDDGELTAWHKGREGWIPSSDRLVINEISDGLSHDLTLYAHDDPSFNTGTRVIQILRDSGYSSDDFEYLLEYRRDQVGRSGYETWDKGIILNWSERAGSDWYECHLLDMQPETSDRKDSGLRIGKTLSDGEGSLFDDIHITPVEEVPGAIPGMRVVINLNSAAGNTAPTGSIAQTYADVNEDITLTVTPSDVDGDTVFAYFWEFDDGSISTDGQAVQTRQWSSAGYHTVSCTISDCKGGVTTVNVDVYVGGDPDQPYAVLAAGPVSSGSDHTFDVTYSTATNGVDVSSIDGNDLTVTGPNGYSELAALVSVDVNSDGSPRVATYSIPAPGGAWDGASSGTYTVTQNANQVESTTGKFAEADVLGTFSVTAFGDTLLTHYTFDESSGSVANDSSGFGHHGTKSGATWRPTGGQIDGALDFGGNASHQVVDEDAEEYLNGLSAITVAAWIKSDDTNTDQGWVLGVEPDGGGGHLQCRYDKQGYLNTSMTQGMQFQLRVTNDGGTTLQGITYESASNVQTTDWQHVVITWESGQPFKVYIDGVEDTPSWVGTDSVADAVATGVLAGAERLVVGRSVKDTGGSWDGEVDDFRIYSYAMDAAEVAALYGGNAAPTLAIDQPGTESLHLPNPASVLVLESTATDPEEDPLTVTWSQVSGPGTASFGNGGELDTYVSFSAPGQYHLQLQIEDGENTVTDTRIINVGPPVAVSQTDRIVYLPLDSDALDAETDDGETNSGTLSGSPVYSPAGGVSGGALVFDGSDDLVGFADSPLINETGPFPKRTVSIWFYPTSVSGRQVVYCEGGTSRGLNLYLEGEVLYAGGWNLNENGWDQTYLSVGGIETDRWYHAAIVLDATPGGTTLETDVFTAYLNGIAFGSGDAAPLNGHSADTGLGAMFDGNRFHDNSSGETGNGHFFSGRIDEFELFNRALTPTEIGHLASIYSQNAAPNVQAGADDTGPMTGIVLGGVVSDADGPSGPVSNWTQVSGPGVTVYNDSAIPGTTATFDATGSYVLQLQATDGNATVFDLVTLTVEVGYVRNNSIPDTWEETWFPTQDTPATVTKNGKEVDIVTVYTWGLSPTDPAAVLMLENGGMNPSGFELQVSTVSNRSYAVERCPDLTAATPVWTQIGSTLVGDGTTQTVTDDATPDAGAYKVRVWIP